MQFLKYFKLVKLLVVVLYPVNILMKERNYELMVDCYANSNVKLMLVIMFTVLNM